jgi:hypothetical protein
MTPRRPILAAGLFAALALPRRPAHGQTVAMPPPDRLAALARGVNVAHWMRFPPSWAEADVIGYLRDSDLAALKRAGFTFIRLPVDPQFVALPDGRIHPPRLRQLEAVVARIVGAGLAVMVEPHPLHSAKLDSDPAFARAMFTLWGQMAPVLAKFPPERVFLELMSEPIFKDRDAEWHAMQRDLARQVRAAAPRHTLIATGAGWSSIDGLLRLHPLPDPNVIYTFHFYWPMAFTHQGANWVGPMFHGLRGLPWPAAPAEACRAALPPQADARADQVAAWYCREAFDAARLVREIGRAREWADRHRVAIVAGEFGGGCHVEDRGARVRWIRDARLALETHRFGWSLWALDSCQGFGAVPRARDFSLAPDILGALGLSAR